MRRFVLLGFVALLAGLSVLSAGPVLAEPSDGPLGCGIIWDSNITYTVESGSSSVGVQGESTLTYPSGASPVCSTNQISIRVPPAIFGMEANSVSGDNLSTTIELSGDEGLSALAFVDLPDQLDPGETLSISFSYWMPDDGVFTVASAEQVSFNAWVWGSPGHISLTVVAESGDTVVAGTSTQPSAAAGSPGVYRYPAITNPDGWIGSVAIFRGPARSTITAHGSGYPTMLHAVDGGAGWTGAAESGVAVGIPTLENLIGVDWPDWKPLDVIEVRDQTLDGYAGRYLPTFHAIQLPADTPQSTMLHELGHAWFNGDLFSDTWVNEGFADLYAYVAESSIPDTDGYVPIAAVPVDAQGPGSIPLVEWEAAESVGAGTEATVEYGYGASYWILSQIEEEIGIEAVSAVVVTAAREVRDTGGPIGSHRLLEIFEEVGGSQQARGLFSEYGAVGAGAAAPEQSAAPGAEPDVEPVVAATPSGSRGVSPVVLVLILLPLVAGFGLIYRSRRRSPKMGSVSGPGPYRSHTAPTGTALTGVPSYLTSTDEGPVSAEDQLDTGADAPWVY